MKRLLIGLIALAFIAGSAFDAEAQGRGNGHYKKARKEYAKQHKNQRKHAFKYMDWREKAYRKYVKDHHKRYRDHDAWYRDKRFQHRTDYVYFPEYRTYYDPYRRGYIYRRSNAWVFAPTMPSFFAGVNVGALNVQFMANLPL